jgi:hypothetical protein
MSVDQAIELVARLVGVAILVEVAELVAIRRSWAWIWRPAWVERELRVLARPLAVVLAPLLRDLRLVLVVRGGAGLALVALGVGPWAWAALVTGILVSVRWRGTYNGGSDQMMVVLSSALALASIDPPRMGPFGLAYIAAQIVLSYFIAGVAKLIEPSWRSGDALYRLRALPRYQVPPGIGALMTRAPRPMAWAIIGVECLAPACFVGPQPALLVLGALALFHLGNAWALGLNRFLLVWLAGFPAVLWTSTLGLGSVSGL